jgi:hypothetical protein
MFCRVVASCCRNVECCRIAVKSTQLLRIHEGTKMNFYDIDYHILERYICILYMLAIELIQARLLPVSFMSVEKGLAYSAPEGIHPDHRHICTSPTSHKRNYSAKKVFLLLH